MIVCVFQMGKVGSSSVTGSLVAAGFHRRPLRDSSANDPFDADKNYAVSGHGGSRSGVKRLLDTCRGNRTSDRVVLVTLIRDLLARNISAFFHHCANPEKENWYFGSRKAIREAHVEDLIAFFRERNALHMEQSIKPWLGRFQEATGISLLDRPFDVEQGLSVYRETDGLRLVAAQLERLTENWDSLRRALDLPRLPMVRSNEGAEKWYADVYEGFKQKYRPSETELDAHYDESLMRHFYSAADLARFREQWQTSPQTGNGQIKEAAESSA